MLSIDDAEIVLLNESIDWLFNSFGKFSGIFLFGVVVWLVFICSSFMSKGWLSFDWFDNYYVAFLLRIIITCIYLGLFDGFVLKFWILWFREGSVIFKLEGLDIFLEVFYADLFWKVFRSNIISTKFVCNSYLCYPIRLGKSRTSLFWGLLEEFSWL